MQASSDSEDGASLRWSSTAMTSSDGDSTDEVNHRWSNIKPEDRHKNLGGHVESWYRTVMSQILNLLFVLDQNQRGKTKY